MQRRRANRYPRTWTARSRSKGSDSMASKSNRVRPNQIGRSWGFGRAGRRRATAGDSVRGGAALGSPEIVESGAPVLGLACGLAGEGLRGARDPLVGSARRDGDRAWLRDGDGGTGRRGTPEYGVRAARGATDYTNRPKGSAGGGYSYRILGRRGVSWKGGSPARSSGDGRSGLVTRSKMGGFLRPGPTG